MDNEKKPSIVATSKDGLIKDIKCWLAERGILANKRGFFLQLNRLDCKCEFKYKTENDIPNTNVVCKHGNKIIVYQKKLPT